MIAMRLIYIQLYVICMYVTVFDACKSNPCLNNGRCDNTTQGFQCKCSGTYEGRTCSGKCYYYLSNYYFPVSVSWTFYINKRSRMCACAVVHARAHLPLYIKHVISVVSDCRMRDNIIISIIEND